MIGVEGIGGVDDVVESLCNSHSHCVMAVSLLN